MFSPVKMKSLILALGAGLLLAIALIVPNTSPGQAPPADDPALNAVITTIAAQQTVIAENQLKIEEKLAVIAEDIRVSRIYVGRAGGRTSSSP